MDRRITILIADRNPNVREFLKREMVSENYRVICAEDAKTMFKLALGPFMVDVLILDPELPDMEASEVLGKLSIQKPALPVIIHSFSEENGCAFLLESFVFIEKGGGSIEVIKRVLKEQIAERVA